MRRPFPTAFPGVLLCLAVAVGLSSCGGNDAGGTVQPQPTTLTIAAQVAKALKAKPGEQISTLNVDNPKPFLVDRLMSITEKNPTWKITDQPPIQRIGAQVRETWGFSDGSSITFVEVPRPGKDTGMRLKSLEVTP